MTKRKLILVDVDDTLLAYSGLYITWLLSQTKYDVDTYKPDTWFQVEYIEDFNKNHLTIRRPINEGVMDFIKLVNNDYDIEFLSSCGVEQHNFQKKCLEQALYNKNIPIVLTCLPLRADKFDIIKKRKPCLILDDKRDFVEKCNAKGFKATYSRDFKELIKILKS